MKKVLVIISSVLVIAIIGYAAYTNRTNNSAYSYHHSDTFSPLDKEEADNANTDNNKNTANNTHDKNEDTVQEEDKPEKIVSTPIEDYDITGYKGDVDTKESSMTFDKTEKVDIKQE